jgi:hypothetical protein
MIPRREFLRRACVLTGLALCGSSASHARPAREALQSAIAFLVGRQSADGAWRSNQYAAFRDGDALTPLVLWVLETAGDSPASSAIARGRLWLERLTAKQATLTEPWTNLHYPLFTAAYSAQFLAVIGDPGRASLWADLVERLRIQESLGWPAGDPACGAWSDSPSPPILPAGAHPLPDMLAPNISATVLALQALAATGRHSRCILALPFLERCQNYSPGVIDNFDDGGFFFAIDDPIRNKAGVASIDSKGRLRFRSYGSATCDGLIGLRTCRLPNDHPRWQAVAGWMRQNAKGLEHVGNWLKSRASARESLVFYYSQALAEALSSLQPADPAWAAIQARALNADLIKLQGADGSWMGRYPDSCEDDSLLATAFAIRALVRVDASGQKLAQR